MVLQALGSCSVAFSAYGARSRESSVHALGLRRFDSEWSEALRLTGTANNDAQNTRQDSVDHK